MELVFVNTHNLSLKNTVAANFVTYVLTELDGRGEICDPIKINSNDLELQLVNLNTICSLDNNLTKVRGFFLIMQNQEHAAFLKLLNETPLIVLNNSKNSLRIMKSESMTSLLDKILLKFPNILKEFDRLSSSHRLTRQELVFIKVLENLRELATCARHKVAAIITDGKDITSIGCNGTDEGQPHCQDLMQSGKLSYEDHREWSLENEIHAEVNAIRKAKGQDLSKHTLLVSHKPCIYCLKVIDEARIRKVVYLNEWTNNETIFVPELGVIDSEKYRKLFTDIELIKFQG